MAPKAKQTTRSIEEILTDIHNTLTEGLEAILAEIKDAKFENGFFVPVLGDVELPAGGPTVEVTDTEGMTRKVAAVEPVTNGEEHPDPDPEETDFTDNSGKEYGGKEEKSALTDIDHNDVPKDTREWIEAHPGCTVAQVAKTHPGIAYNRLEKAVKKYGKPATKKEEKPKITVEALREKISEFAEKFGMNEALKVNDIFGGAKKVSMIPEKKYAAVYEEMDRRLSESAQTEADTDANAEAALDPEAEMNEEISIDDVRAAAQPFVEKYGDPAFRELLKKFGAAKISAVDPSKYAALIEALTNA